MGLLLFFLGPEIGQVFVNQNLDVVDQVAELAVQVIRQVLDVLNDKRCWFLVRSGVNLVSAVDNTRTDCQKA
jgi:hypothetical protein